MSRTLRCGFMVVSALAMIVATGCGGGHGGAGGSSGGGSGDAASTRATLDAVEAKCSALAGATSTPADFNAQLAAYLSGRSEFEAAGVDDTTSCIWARFKNGQLLVIANNRKPGPVTNRGIALPVASGRAVIPSSKQVRLLHSFGPNFDDVQQPVTDIGNWLTAHGYKPAAGAVGDASLDVLRSVSGDGFFYFNSHSGRGHTRTLGDMFTIQSSTIITADTEKDAVIQDDLANSRLVRFMAPNGDVVPGTDIPLYDTRYGITANFVNKYMSFGKGCVVYVNGCFSAYTGDAAGAGPFIAACTAKGAAVYVGWSGSLSPNAAFGSVRYFVDRLVGANQYQAESPDQRAFDVNAVLTDMARAGLDTDTQYANSKLVAFPSPLANPAILAPSIHHLEVDEENRQLKVFGTFGTDQGTVSVGGSDLPIVSWASDEIVCGIPDSGAGSAGDVIVTVNDHKSNTVQLTEWRLHFTMWQTFLGSERYDGTADVHLRADIHSYRDKPHDDPTDPTDVQIGQAHDIKGQYAATGTYASGGVTSTWSGSVSLVPAAYNAGSPNYVMAFGTIDVKAKALTLALVAVSAQGMTDTIVSDSGTLTHLVGATTGALDGGFPTNQVPALKLTFDSGWGIAADKREDDTPGGKRHIDWQKCSPSSPPDPDAARSMAAGRR